MWLKGFLVTKLSPRIDRLGWILIALAITFYFVIPLPYYIATLNNSNSFPEWHFIVWVMQGLGIVMAFAFTIHQSNRKKDTETKPND
jgi:peptidoglycan/LPS O-acetylase OafA/YrhL